MSATADISPSDIAIIGMSCRFADAPDYASLRRNLWAARECIPRPSRDELAAAGVPDALLDDPNYVYAGGPLPGLAEFDAEFFGMSPREAEVTDPQHRLFLECAWEALEDAGQIATAAGQAVGVWGGTSTSLYLLQNLQHASAVMQTVGGLGATIGNKSDFVTLRVSHKLDLRGPSFNVQSGCSTGLVAVHCAVQSLLAGECRMALAGAASLTQLQPGGYLYQPGSIESPDGHCRAFDAQAGGTTRGSGAAVVVLKRLADALADGDPIHAVIKATATNNDGADKIGMTAPSELGQAAVIAEALALAGLGAEDIGAIEAHGTGTALGDPIEVAALTRVFRQTTQRRGFCAIGSIKSNIGHLDAAAGIASLIKAVLMVRHREIYPTLHFTAPNPEIDFASGPLFVAAQAQPFAQAVPRVGVSSFGMGGTNVHAVVQAPPELPRPPASETTAPQPVLLVLSARTPQALQALSLRMADTLTEPAAPALADVARTLQTGRRHFACRRHVVARTAAEAADALRQGHSGQADALLDAVGRQWCDGASPDWRSLPGTAQARHVHLPTYPFQRQRHWIEPPRDSASLTTPVWTQVPLPATPVPLAPAGPWWLVASAPHAGARAQAAARLRAQGIAVREIDAAAVEHEGAGAAPAVVVAWPGAGHPRALLDSVAATGVNAPTRVLLLVERTATVLGDESLDVEEAAELAGALAWRHPWIATTAVDLLPGMADPLPLQQLATLPPSMLAWRGKTCFARQTAPLASTVGAASAAPLAGTDGWHVVQPGLQPAGLQWARALIAAGARRVALLDAPLPARFALPDFLQALDAQAGPWSSTPRPAALQHALDRLAAAHTCQLLHAAGLSLRPGARHALSELLVRVAPQPPYPRMLRAQLADLESDGLLRIDDDRLEVLPAMAEVRPVQHWQDWVAQHHPDHLPLVALLAHCTAQHAAVFAGQLPGTAVVASPEGTQRLRAAAEVINRHSSRPHCLRVVADMVRALAQAAPRPLRILEVGGGTGSLTRPLLQRLGNLPVDYCFTDIGTTFVVSAQHEIQRRGLRGVQAKRLDISADPLTQGFSAGQFDLVLGLDVVHATADLSRSLSNLRGLLRPGGWLCLIESLRVQRWVEHIWGLETGWWHFNDAWRQHSPLTGPDAWHAAMLASGLSPLAIRPQGEESQQGHDTGWLLAEHAPRAAAAEAPLSDWLAARHGALRSTLDALDALARQHGAELRQPAAHAPAMPDAVALGVFAGDADDQGPASDAMIAALAPQGTRVLLSSPPRRDLLAAWQSIRAQQHEGVTAWTGVTAVDARGLAAVLGSGCAVVSGHVPPQPSSTGAARPATAADTAADTPHQVITQLWCELLGVDQVAPDDDWYALGGDSLLTTRVITLLEQRYRVPLPVDRFFNATTVTAMAEALAEAIGPAEGANAQALLAQIEAMSEDEIAAALRQAGAIR